MSASASRMSGASHHATALMKSSVMTPFFTSRLDQLSVSRQCCTSSDRSRAAISGVFD
jgi:hypothetical protein